MPILPTYNVDNLFTSQEIDSVDQYIRTVGKNVIIDSEDHEKHVGKIISNNIFWDYHLHPEIEKILTSKLENLLQKKLLVTDAHILESKIPYLIHTDFIHNNQGLKGINPEYTIIIPLDNYDSITVCFNEWAECNDFEIFKQNYQGEKKIKIDPKFCADCLSHLHPKDLMYLSLHDTFTWKKGSVFAMDRRYFHCSDNFPRRGLVQKRAIVLWTYS
jgi:hypothetical protein